MPIVTNKRDSQRIFEKAAERGVSVAIFCTASHWNTEAILMAAQRMAEQAGVESVPVVVATTFTYKHMPQARRFLYCRDPIAGFLSHMGHLRALTDEKYGPYRGVTVLPHLDHADPERDRWALTAGTPYFSSVMFDAQRFPYEENRALTAEYVKQYGRDVLVEGIMEQLNVEGGAVASQLDDYCGAAADYVGATGVDFLVADLGTEQQTSSAGGAVYLKERALDLTAALGRKMLVLHGTSSLTAEQTKGLAADGVVRVNMWTRIARKAGQFAAEKLEGRMDAVREGAFDAAEANQYIRDNTDKAAEIMLEMMKLFGYMECA